MQEYFCNSPEKIQVRSAKRKRKPDRGKPARKAVGWVDQDQQILQKVSGIWDWALSMDSPAADSLEGVVLSLSLWQGQIERSPQSPHKKQIVES